MKLFRIVLAVLVLITAVVGAGLTAKLVKVRNSWVKKNLQLAKDAETARQKLDDSRAELATLQNRVQQVTLAWGNAWDNRATQIANPARGQVQVEIGSDQLTLGQTIYGYELAEDGTSVFRGEFKVVEAQETSSKLQPTFRVRPSDVRNWKAGNWRWRQNMPTGALERFKAMEVQFVRGDELAGDLRRQIQQQDDMIAEAEEQRLIREAELLGGENLPDDPGLEIEYREGLVAAMESVDAERSAKLTKIDELRRQARRLATEIRDLERENRMLLKSRITPQTASAAAR